MPMDGTEKPTASLQSPPTPPSANPAIDRLLGDRYRRIRLLGEGGQKCVYLARDARLDREVVIAMLKTDGLDRAGITRLHHEARALARLGDHPNIVAVHDLVEEDGHALLIAQYVEGGSLREFRRSVKGGRLPFDQVIRVGVQVAEALHYAHLHGIIHRDVKPANIWLTRDGVAKLGDFGLATGLNLSRVTPEGALLGTAAYIAPEQAIGGTLEPRSDLYSLGVVLYELVAGRRPFEGDSVAAIVSQHLYAPPVAPSCHRPGIPEPLERVILSLLAKDPKDRLADGSAVSRALSAVRSLPEAEGREARLVRPLDRLAAGVFVGRTEELDGMKAVIEDGLAGRGGTIVLIGEPGSGKTATAEQLLTYSRLRGAQVVRGHGYEGEGAPAYWPWVQVLRELTEQQLPSDLSSWMGAGAPVIAQLDPVIAARLPAVPLCEPLEPAQARFRLFDSVTAYLKYLSSRRPLVVFSDDLHWADSASLLLIQFLAREIRNSPLLLVVTLRDMQFERGHPLAQTLAALSTLPGHHRVVLGGLSESEVGRFIEITVGLRPPTSLVEAVYAETEGNPFFVKEVLRLLVTTEQLEDLGSDKWRIALPEGVRDVVNRRLAGLSADTIQALSVASVVGREFELATVRESLEHPLGLSVLELLEEAMAARLIQEVPQSRGRYRFSHALIRETLYASISVWRRLHLHRRVGETLEKLYPAEVDARVAELAHHFVQAIALGDAEKAIAYAVRAAERSDALLAYEEAANQYAAALRAIDAQSTPDRRRRCDLLLARAEAEAKAGLSGVARDSFLEAATLAREAEFADALARAALGLGFGAAADRASFSGFVDELQVALLREAIARIGEGSDAVRARLIAQLALAMYRSPVERTTLSEEAVMLARRSGDASAHLAALFSRCVSLLGFDRSEERLDLAREIVEVAERVGDKEMSLRGRYRCLRELMEMGDIAGVEREIGVYAHLAERVRQPRHSWYVQFCRASLALLRGQFDQCERLTADARAIGRRAQDSNVTIYCGILAHTADWLRGRFEQCAKLLEELIAAYPAVSANNRVILARMYCFMDRVDEARREFEGLAANGFDDAPVDGGRLAYICSLATTCSWLRDQRRAEQLYRLIEPFRRRNVLAGNAAVFGGPVAQYLAGLAAVLGRWETAENLYREADARNETMGSRPWQAMALCGQARMFLVRRRPEDEGRAHEVLKRANSIGKELGMAWVTSWTGATLDSLRA
jgi:eukaryotic-like serine/threonine-protein kinase